MRLPQRSQDRAAITFSAGALGDDAFKFGGHVVQFANTVPDIGEVLACDDVDIAAGHSRIVVEAEEAPDLFQAEAETAATADESQPVDFGRAVFPVAAGSASWGEHQARTLVIADGFQVTPTGSRCFTDFHSHCP